MRGFLRRVGGNHGIHDTPPRYRRRLTLLPLYRSQDTPHLHPSRAWVASRTPAPVLLPIVFVLGALPCLQGRHRRADQLPLLIKREGPDNPERRRVRTPRHVGHRDARCLELELDRDQDFLTRPLGAEQGNWIRGVSGAGSVTRDSSG